LWRRRQGANLQPLGTHADPDVTLDLGQTVLVTQWGEDGCAHVTYRGAPWTARLKVTHPDQPPSPGPHRICAMQGNQLIIEKV
ncbi:MAG TPA: NfeD family protein, partial [Aquabacterium sp.]|nr:NfeD family protein [Aquabacterium sp.]